jgi:hypothetical protein
MNVFKGFAGFLTLLPYIVTGAEAIHSLATGPEKKASVMKLAAIALSGVAQELPNHAAAIEAAAPHISNAIDGIVGSLNALGVLSHKASTHGAAASAAAGA